MAGVIFKAKIPFWTLKCKGAILMELYEYLNNLPSGEYICTNEPLKVIYES